MSVRPDAPRNAKGYVISPRRTGWNERLSTARTLHVLKIHAVLIFRRDAGGAVGTDGIQ